MEKDTTSLESRTAGESLKKVLASKEDSRYPIVLINYNLGEGTDSVVGFYFREKSDSEILTLSSIGRGKLRDLKDSIIFLDKSKNDLLRVKYNSIESYEVYDERITRKPKI